MNKAQKEVLSTQLNSEKATLLKLKRIYQQASKDCEHKIALLSARKDMENLQSVIYQKQYQQALKTQIDGVLAVLEGDQFDTVADYLKESYESGYTGVMYDLAKQGIPIVMPIDQKQVAKALEVDSKLSQGLYTRLHEDIGCLKKSIRAELSRGIANGSSWNDIATHIAEGMNSPFHRSLSNATRIARTEGHRIQQQSANDAQKKAVEKGADVVKQWCSMLDNRIRHNHAVLDGQIKELDELFTVNGKSAPYPGGFGDPAEDCNCRCCMTQRARWALDDEELKELKERAKYFGLDKTEDFDEFKNKYCKLPAKADRVKMSTKKPIEEPVDEKQRGSEMLRRNYEDHRILNDLQSAPYDSTLDNLISADYGKMSVETQKMFNDTLDNLLKNYDSSLQKIRMMDRSELVGNMGSFAFTRHNYETDMSELVFNHAKCGNYTKLTDRIKELSKKGYSVEILESDAGKYIPTHEFAHTLLGMQDSLKNNRNWVKADYKKIKKARKEIETVYDDYLNEIEEYTKLKKKYEFEFMMNDNVEAGEKARELSKKIKEVQISKYSLVNSDEFMAEAFTNEQIGVNKNKYSKRVVEILDKYFKKE